uniref:Exonuclease domain-containing protein n=2 Tax=Aegilops tauschii subsp. strangulata TaxID=200361 RepID=A0A453BS63_AEGTS
AHRSEATAAVLRGFIFNLGKIWERMANLANMFAVLDLDGEDDRKEVEQPTSSKPEAAATAAARKPDSGMVNNKMIVNYNGDTLGSSSSEYKMPLVWIDLEMTGLDIRKDRILEIACIITDGKLTKRIEGPDLVIRQSKECLDNMNEWCKTHHGASGLTEQVLQSDISECDAEKQVLDFVRRYIGSATPLIAGNSIYTDLLFLKEYMPQLAGIFPHVIVDVSSITALCIRWFPKERKQAPRKEKNHRALDDIRESIMELQYYKENIFKSRQSKH